MPRNAADTTEAEVLGEIVWLMSQSAEHTHHTIADLEGMVMPAILLRQFRPFYKEGRLVAVMPSRRDWTPVSVSRRPIGARASACASSKS